MSATTLQKRVKALQGKRRARGVLVVWQHYDGKWYDLAPGNAGAQELTEAQIAASAALKILFRVYMDGSENQEGAQNEPTN